MLQTPSVVNLAMVALTASLEPARFPAYDGPPAESYEQYREASLEAATSWIRSLVTTLPHLAQLRPTELYDCACRALAMEIYREPNPYEAALISKALQLVVGRPMAVVEG